MAAGAALFPLASRAQQSSQMLRVGMASSNPRTNLAIAAFEQQMLNLGYRDGETYIFEFVKVPDLDGLDAGYRELMKRKPDIIITGGPEYALKSAIAHSGNTPIVMLAVDFDPVARGYVKGIASSGGRITGLFLPQLELTAKRLQFFKDTFPDMGSATVLWDSVSADQWEAAQQAGAQFGVRLSGAKLGALPYDYENALSRVAPEFRAYLFALASPPLFQDRVRLANFALSHRMASIFAFQEWAEAGGLMSYGPSITEMFTRAAQYVDRIAHGVKPADLPIEQPTQYDFVINLSTARTLGVEISPLMLARATKVID